MLPSPLPCPQDGGNGAAQRQRGGLKASVARRGADKVQRMGPVMSMKAHHWGDATEVEVSVQVS